MYLHNITRTIGTDIAMAPVAAGTGDTQTGLAIDTFGYESLVFLVYLGTVTSTGTAVIKLQHGDASDLSDAADVTNGALTAVSTSNKGYLSVEVFRPTKRYYRVAVTRATANVVINGAVVLLGRAGTQPPAQGATMAGSATPAVLVSP